MNHRIISRAILSLLALFAAVPAFAREAETVRIGVCLSLTGEFAASGRKALAGVKLRQMDFNSRAGEHGMRIELVIRDDKSNPEQAASIVGELAKGEGVPAIVGPLSTNLMLGMRMEAHKHEVVLVSPSVTSPKVGWDGDWAFRVLFDDEFQGVALARYLARELGAKKSASIVNRHLAYANSVNNAFTRTFEDEGGTSAIELQYIWIASEQKLHDFSQALDLVARENPDFILLPNNSADIIEIIRQSLKTDIQTRFCGGDTWLHENILFSAGNNLEGAVFVSGIDYDADTPAMRRYMDLYDNSNDPDAQPSSVLGYDAMSLVIEGLRNGRTAHEIRDGLYRVKNFPLATGSITIDPVRGSEKTAYIHRVTKRGGEFVAEIIGQIKP